MVEIANVAVKQIIVLTCNTELTVCLVVVVTTDVEDSRLC